MVVIGLAWFWFCSTRVANELGAGNAKAAKLAFWIVLVIATMEAVIVSTILFFCRYILGHAFSSDREVVNHVADMVPILCIAIILDAFQAVLSGFYFFFLSNT